jgi:hypothetical protein
MVDGWTWGITDASPSRTDGTQYVKAQGNFGVGAGHIPGDTSNMERMTRPWCRALTIAHAKPFVCTWIQGGSYVPFHTFYKV